MKKTITINQKLILFIAIVSLHSVAFAQSQNWITRGNALITGDFIGSTNSFPLIFTTNNISRMQITAAGNLGIGTTLPTQLLDINGSTRTRNTAHFDANIVIGSNISVGGVISPVNNASPLIFNTNTLTRMQITSVGNIGIGTTVPTQLIDVSGTSRTRGTATFDADIIVGTNLSMGGTISPLSATLPLIFNTNALTRLEITSAGNIGIGTTLPTQLLDVSGTSRTRGTANFDANIIVGTNLSVGGTISPVSATLPLIFNTNALTRMQITSAGNIGIGTTLPTQLLDVNGTSRIRGTANFDANIIVGTNLSVGGTISPGSTTLPMIFNTNNLARVQITPAGNVGIGTTVPTQLLDVNGASRTRGTANFDANVVVGTNLSLGGSISPINTTLPLIFNTNNVTRMQITPAGSIGIGTSAPAALLEVLDNGNINRMVASFSSVNSPNPRRIFMVPDLSAAGYNFMSKQGDAGIFWTDGTNGTSSQNSTAGLVLGPWDGGAGIRLTADGKMGVGVSSPLQTLDVAGNVNATGYMINNQPLNTYWVNGTVNQNDIYYSTGNAGIGTSVPLCKLDVHGGNALVKGINNYVNPNDEGAVYLGDQTNYVKSVLGLGVKIGVSGTGDVITVFQAGNVGIGTTNPLGIFEVNDKQGNKATIVGSFNSQDQAGNPHRVFTVPYLYQSAYSFLTQDGDAGIFFSDGSAGGGHNLNAGLVIAPWDDASGIRIAHDGNVGVGISSPQYKLDVCGTIRGNEVRVNLAGCDFVFENKYQLMPLTELEQFIKENKHLPEIASAKDMEMPKGVSLGEMQSSLLQKVEELTLYVIEQNKKIVQLEEKVNERK